MNREKIASDLIDVAKSLVARESGYKDAMRKLDDEYKRNREELMKQFWTSRDFTERPNESLKDIKAQILKKVGGKKTSTGSIEYRLGSGWKNSKRKSILQRISTILKRNKIDVPSNLDDLELMRDGDGKRLIGGFSA